MEQQRKLPVRTCVACRARSPQGELLRFGLEKQRTESSLTPAAKEVRRWCVYRVKKAGVEQNKAQGRSAYLHSDVGCARKASATNAWEHAFRLKRGSLCESTLRACLDEVMADALRRVTSLQGSEEQNADRSLRPDKDYGPKRRTPRMRL